MIRQRTLLFINRMVSVPKHIHVKGFCAELNFSEVILSIKLYISERFNVSFIYYFIFLDSSLIN